MPSCESQLRHSTGLRLWSISASPLASVSPALVRAVTASASLRDPSDIPVLTDACGFPCTHFLPRTEDMSFANREQRKVWTER